MANKIYRTFNHKRYRAESYFTTRREALARARTLRRRGYLARVIKQENKYYVWYY